MDIGVQFSEIMLKKMQSLPLQEMAQVYVDKTLEDTRMGVNPGGDPMPAYAPSTVKRKGRANVDMRDRDHSIEEVDFQFTDDVATLFFPEKSEVFEMHFSGTARGGNIRKVVPSEQDENSPGMEQSYEQVKQILQRHFNA